MSILRTVFSMAIFRTAAVTVQFSSMSCADSAGGNVTMSQTKVSAGIHDRQRFCNSPPAAAPTPPAAAAMSCQGLWSAAVVKEAPSICTARGLCHHASMIARLHAQQRERTGTDCGQAQASHHASARSGGMYPAVMLHEGGRDTPLQLSTPPWLAPRPASQSPAQPSPPQPAAGGGDICDIKECKLLLRSLMETNLQWQVRAETFTLRAACFWSKSTSWPVSSSPLAEAKSPTSLCSRRRWCCRSAMSRCMSPGSPPALHFKQL